jgi:hypothetical protein
MTYDPRYHGLYDDRFLKPGMLPAVVPETLDMEWSDGKIRDFLRDWPGAGLEERMKVHFSRRNDMSLLAGLKNGQLTLKGKTFTFRDEERRPRDIDSLYEAVDKELAEDHAVFERWDEQCFSAHLNAAKVLAKREAGQSGWAEDLLRRYQFHLETQELLRAILNDDYRMNSALRYLSGKSELPDEEYQALLQLLREICDSLAGCVEKAQTLACPALTNVPEGTPLRRLIWEKDADLPQFDTGVNSIRFEWINDYLRKQNAAQDRLRRIHYKSLGQILALQEKIAGVWLKTQCEELPAVAELIAAPHSSAPAAPIDGN